MAKNRGWWDLDLHGQRMDDLSDIDREHIARCIVGGGTGGEIVKDEDFNEDGDIYPDIDQVEINIKPKYRE